MPETYEVKQGDTTISIAHQKGYRNWETIWYHDDNAALRDQRPNPQVLLPGDKLVIPDKVPKEHTCDTNHRHTFVLPVLTAHVRVVIEDDDGKPYVSKNYTLAVGGEEYHGKTDSQGAVDEEVPADAQEGDLTLWPDAGDKSQVLTWKLQLGHLDPIGELSGVQARLNNLGYVCGEVTGEMNDATKQALMAFQAANDLEPSGKADAATRAKLEDVHD